MVDENDPREDAATGSSDAAEGQGGQRRTSRSGTVPMVGLCSSAGGLDALMRFFGAMPIKSGMAFLVVPHLDPTHESMMVQLLANKTAIPVEVARSGVRVEPDRVYVIPPNRELSVRDGVLVLADSLEPRGGRTAIDDFLRSLAEDQRERAIAVVLSGTGSHGTFGVKQVKLCGGMVIVQTLASAEFDSMPRSAIDTGLADYVLDPENMPAALMAYVRQPYIGDPPPPGLTPEDGQLLDSIMELVRDATNGDFRHYRKSMLMRRVQRRMGLRQALDLVSYKRRLESDPDEVGALYRDILIGVTAFFREPHAFRVLERRVIPELVKRSDGEQSIRVWVPACATGEEAYSIGVLFLEAFEAAGRAVNIQIFATDLDSEALNVARRAEYAKDIMSEVSEERLGRFFVPLSGGRFRVCKELRDIVIFAQQSLIGDSPFSRIDLVSCRNLLIYMEADLQAKVLGLLHFSLRDGGYLVLGPSESLGRQSHMFEVVSKKWRVFKRMTTAMKPRVEFPISGSRTPRAAGGGEAPGGARIWQFNANRLADLARRTLLAEYAPASVFINRLGDVLYYHGCMVDYLEFPSGQPSSDVLSMARKGLRNRLRAAIRRAQDTGTIAIDSGARVLRGDVYVPCRIAVRPVVGSRSPEDLLLVSFEDIPAPSESRSTEGGRPDAGADAGDVGAGAVEQLEMELRETREDLSGAISELESSNEELRASNEEIMSMNEELQSANEELETSKEELQSVNEELRSLNSELEIKIRELEAAGNNMTNLLDATEIASLFLDRDMCVSLCTPAAAKLMQLGEGDIGRRIADFRPNSALEGLSEDSERVLHGFVPVERDFWIHDGERRCFARRIVPYKTADNRVEGVVVAFRDVTEQRASESLLQERVERRTSELVESRNRLASVFEAVADAVVTVDASGAVEMFNGSAERMFGYPAAEVVGQNVSMLVSESFVPDLDAYVRACRVPGTESVGSVGRDMEGLRRGGEVFPVHVTLAPVAGPGDRWCVGVIRDLSELAGARQDLERSNAISQSILSTARVIILSLDTSGAIIDFNPYMEELCGFRVEEVRGESWFARFIPERERPESEAAFRRAIQGQRNEGFVCSVMTKGGGCIRVEWYDSLLRVPGEQIAILAVGQDITARERLEQDMLRTQKLEVVGRLASGVAHDFNNLLAGISGGLRMIASEIGPEHPATAMLSQVSLEAQRGVSITRRLLDYSRTRVPSRARVVDVRGVLRAGVVMLRRFLGEDIDMKVSYEGARSFVRIEPEGLEQALLNIVLNARDALPGGGRIDIECRDVDLTSEGVGRLGASCPEGPYVMISVSDNGFGMDEPTRSSALDAFFTTKAPGLGSGLGLASAASTVRSSGGSLVIESEQGVGTTVRILLPRVDEEAASTHIAHTVPVTNVPRGSGEHVLVVEDEFLVRLGVQHSLEQLGYRVVAVPDMSAAWHQLASESVRFDVLLTDVVLPGGSGGELAARVLERSPGVRVVFMSALAAEDLVSQGRVPVGARTLQKPFSDQDLAEVIRSALIDVEGGDPRGDE